MSKVKIIPACEAEQEAILKFFRQQWPRRTALDLSEFYNWQMLKPPAAGGRDNSLVAIDQGGAIQGYIGSSLQHFNDKLSYVQRATTTTSIILAPEHRGGLLGFNLLKQVMKNVDVMVGMNLNPVSQAMLRRLGHHFIRAVERMVRVYNIEPFEHLIDWTPGAKNLLALQKPKSRQPLPDYSYPSKDEIASRFTSYQLPAVNHFSRDWNFLNWRYFQHPIHQFGFILLEPEKPDLTTLLVLRQEHHQDFKLAHVMDILPLGQGLPNYSEVLDIYAKENGLDLIDAMISLPRLTAPLWQAGWLSTLNDVDLPLPNLFNPLELRSPPTGNCAVWSAPGLPFLGDSSSLYISKADGDFDRPTLDAVKRLNPDMLKTLPAAATY